MLYTRQKLLELLERYLALATKGHAQLDEVAKIQRTQIEALERVLDKEGSNGQSSELSTVLDGFIQAQSMLLDELESSHEKTRSLQDELGKAQGEMRLDPLTHIFNRKKLQEDVEQFLTHPPSDRLRLFILVIDADDFKRINDTHGHLAGDKVLIYLARLLRTALQEESHLYRYGGEEFVVLSFHVNRQEAVDLAEQLRKKVETSQMSYQDRPISLTVSIGVSGQESGDHFDTLFSRADSAVLRAKNRGRNRVMTRF